MNFEKFDPDNPDFGPFILIGLVLGIVVYAMYQALT